MSELMNELHKLPTWELAALVAMFAFAVVFLIAAVIAILSNEI